MSKMVQVRCGVILTIARPNGSTERVENKTYTFGEIPVATYRAMVKATKDAGRGNILSQEPMYAMVADIEPTAGDLAEQADYDHRRMVERTSANGKA